MKRALEVFKRKPGRPLKSLLEKALAEKDKPVSGKRPGRPPKSASEKGKVVKDFKLIKKNEDMSKQNNPERDREDYRCAWIEDYPNFFTGKIHPINEAFLEHLGKELVEYSKVTPILNLEYFFLEKGMQPATASRWSKKFPVFGVLYNAAKGYLGIRREHGALTKELSEKMVLHSQHRYDDSFREDAEFHAKLKQEMLSGVEGAKVIVLDRLFEDKKS